MLWKPYSGGIGLLPLGMQGCFTKVALQTPCADSVGDKGYRAGAGHGVACCSSAQMAEIAMHLRTTAQPLQECMLSVAILCRLPDLLKLNLAWWRSGATGTKCTTIGAS